MPTTEQDIIERCSRGEREAFRSIVEKYQRMIFSLALKLLCDEEDAKDAVQDTFVSAWTHLSRYDTSMALSTWLYTIASRLCLDRLRRSSRIVPLADDKYVLHRFASDSDSQRTLENNEWVALVRTMADGLAPKQRLVFTLSLLEGLLSKEVEQITGMTAVQVKSNLYAARQIIRKRLKDLGYE